MKSTFYLFFLIALVFGGGYLALDAYGLLGRNAQTAELGTVTVAEKSLNIVSAVPAALDSGQRLDVVIGAKDAGEMSEVVPQVFALCQALAEDAAFKMRLTGITELNLAFSHPDSAAPEFPVTLPISGGVCQ